MKKEDHTILSLAPYETKIFSIWLPIAIIVSFVNIIIYSYNVDYAGNYSEYILAVVSIGCIILSIIIFKKCLFDNLRSFLRFFVIFSISSWIGEVMWLKYKGIPSIADIFWLSSNIFLIIGFLKLIRSFRELNRYILFSWDGIPGNDTGKLIDFLNLSYKVDWVKAENIKKSGDGNTISASAGNNSFSLSLNDDKTKVNLEINGRRTDEFTANGKLNIYNKEFKLHSIDKFFLLSCWFIVAIFLIYFRDILMSYNKLTLFAGGLILLIYPILDGLLITFIILMYSVYRTIELRLYWQLLMGGILATSAGNILFAIDRAHTLVLNYSFLSAFADSFFILSYMIYALALLIALRIINIERELKFEFDIWERKNKLEREIKNTVIKSSWNQYTRFAVVLIVTEEIVEHFAGSIVERFAESLLISITVAFIFKFSFENIEFMNKLKDIYREQFRKLVLINRSLFDHDYRNLEELRYVLKISSKDVRKIHDEVFFQEEKKMLKARNELLEQRKKLERIKIEWKEPDIAKLKGSMAEIETSQEDFQNEINRREKKIENRKREIEQRIGM